MQLTEEEKVEALKIIMEIMAVNGAEKENLIPILQQAQDRLGYLPGPAMEKIAGELGIPAVDVYGAATFYNQFRLNPPGENQIKVCMGTACYMAGGQIALESFERRLEIKEDETTPDRKCSLERVACVGCCSMAPVVVINDKVEGHVTPTRVDGIILSLQEGNDLKKETAGPEGEGDKLK